MCGEVIEVDSFVGAAGCEDNFLSLVWDGRRRRGERQTSDCRGMGIEEEGICELHFAGRWNGDCDAVENSIVGPRYNLNCDGSLGIFGRWRWRWRRSRFDLLAGSCLWRNGRFTICWTLSFCHGVDFVRFLIEDAEENFKFKKIVAGIMTRLF